jgi:hypothetical protein
MEEIELYLNRKTTKTPTTNKIKERQAIKIKENNGYFRGAWTMQ